MEWKANRGKLTKDIPKRKTRTKHSYVVNCLYPVVNCLSPRGKYLIQRDLALDYPNEMFRRSDGSRGSRRVNESWKGEKGKGGSREQGDRWIDKEGEQRARNMARMDAEC